MLIKYKNRCRLIKMVDLEFNVSVYMEDEALLIYFAFPSYAYYQNTTDEGQKF